MKEHGVERQGIGLSAIEIHQGPKVPGYANWAWKKRHIPGFLSSGVALLSEEPLLLGGRAFTLGSKSGRTLLSQFSISTPKGLGVLVNTNAFAAGGIDALKSNLSVASLFLSSTMSN